MQRNLLKLFGQKTILKEGLFIFYLILFKSSKFILFDDFRLTVEIIMIFVLIVALLL
jgi:hypothetical protein